MNISISTKALKTALNALYVETKASYALLQYVKVTANDDSTVTFTSWNLRNEGVMISVTVSGTVEKAGSVALRYADIKAVLKNCKTPYTTIEGCKVNGLAIKDENTDDLPAVSDYVTNEIYSVSGLASMLKSLIPYAAKDDIRPILNAINLQLCANRVIGATSDGHQLGVYQLDNVVGSGLYEINIPLDSAKHISKVFTDADVLLSISEKTDTLILEQKDVVAHVTLRSGRFPDYNSVNRGLSDTGVTVNRVELINAIETLSTLAKEYANSVRFTYAPGKIVVSTGKVEQGWAIEIAAVHNLNYTAHYNYTFLLTWLKGFAGETAAYGAAAGDSPLHSRENGFTVTIMPMSRNE